MSANSTPVKSKIANVDLCRVSIAIAIIATVAFRNWSFIVYAAQAFMVLMVLSRCAKKRLLPNIGLYVACFGFFVFWCVLSSYWAISPERTLAASVGVFQFVVLGSFVALYSLMDGGTEFLIECLAWAGVAGLLILIILTPSDAWVAAAQKMTDAASGSNRIGGTIGYNSNALGHVFAVCIVIWFYKYQKTAGKLIYLLTIAAFAIVLLFTKSRLSIVLAVVCILLYHLILARGSIRKLILAAVFLLVGAAILWALFYVPALYQLVGFRFAGLFGVSGAVDASTSTRQEMIRVALELFRQNPIRGVGFANYAVHYFNDYSGWAATYAHSNYAELLADLGIVGMVSYYAVPVWTFVSLIRTRGSAENREIHYLLLALQTGLLVADYASISYTNDFTQIFWAISFAYAIAVQGSIFLVRNKAQIEVSQNTRQHIRSGLRYGEK